ncbi:MAG: paraquat-inducible protein A [Desulfopila sp.]
MKPDPHITARYDRLLACPDCDLLLPKLQPPRGHKTACPRCGYILLYHCHETVSRSLALALTGLFLFFPALFLPVLTFGRLGLHETGSIFHTIIGFLRNDYFLVALVAFFSTVLFPLLKLTLLAIVSSCLQWKKYPRFLGKLFRIYKHLGEWAMMEVYLLGITVTIIKMQHSTDISFNVGFFCFIGLVLITMASSLTVCHESFWILIESRGRQRLQHFNDILVSPTEYLGQTAAANNLLLCRECGKISEVHDTDAPKQHCDRCGAALHFRKPHSLSKTWALTLTAAILLFPANLLPIMRVNFLGIPSSSTILDGIKIFFQDGSYIIALIILAASILIPLFKITGLTIILLSIRLRQNQYIRQQTAMFRLIEFIGRWSMLDIFVVALLGFFVNFGFLSSIETAPGATYFCLVVVTTMFAAIAFDPRLLWDVVNTETPARPAVQ